MTTDRRSDATRFGPIANAATEIHTDGQRAAPATPASLVAGARIGHYELIREIGRGGMGVVFAARDLRLGRRVAIKFMFGTTREVADRFLSEARATAQCNHENIVIIHAADEHDGIPYMVLEYLDGSSLREIVEATPRLPPSRVVELMLPIARGLARAHDLGIVHRDLKPENVFVTTAGQVKVLDFGIAKALAPAQMSRRTTSIAAVDVQSTSDGAFVGTLAYMSPEQMSAGEIVQRVVLWAAGVMMFEMLAGRHPVEPLTAPDLIETLLADGPMLTLRAIAPDVPDDLAAIVDRCLVKAKDHRIASAHELATALEALLPRRASRGLAAEEHPYPGLVAFQEGDADRFFGRGPEVARMIAKVREHPVTAVVGPSGAGKSSFVRAGVAPALKASGERWEMIALRPGRHPLASLATIAQRLTNTDHQIDLAAHLRHEPGYLGAVLRHRATHAGGNILVFVDQLEELFTLVADPVERAAFVAALAGVADDPVAPLRVVIAMRADFLDRLTETPAFADDVSRGLVFLATLDRTGLREATVQPVEQVGYRFESTSLVDDMLDALGTTHGALPLLQFAASKLWDARDRERRLITIDSYRAIGGVSGALASHADEVVAGMDANGQRLTQKILRALVTPERTRAIVEITELQHFGADVPRVIDQLVAARLLVSQSGAVEIVHESLIDRWPTLRRWLDQDEDDAAFHAQLVAAARQWEAKHHAAGLLWRGEAFDETRRWLAAKPRELAPRERAFVDAMLRLARRRRWVWRGVAALIAAGTIAAFVAVHHAKENALADRTAAMTAMQNAETSMHEAQQALAARKAAESEAMREQLNAKQAAAAADSEHKNAEHQTELARAADIDKMRAEAAAMKADAARARADADRANAEASAAKALADKKTAEMAAMKQVSDAHGQIAVTNDQLRRALVGEQQAESRAKAADAKAKTAEQDATKAKQDLAKAQARITQLEHQLAAQPKAPAPAPAVP